MVFYVGLVVFVGIGLLILTSKHVDIKRNPFYFIENVGVLGLLLTLPYAKNKKYISIFKVLDF